MKDDSCDLTLAIYINYFSFPVSVLLDMFSSVAKYRRSVEIKMIL